MMEMDCFCQQTKGNCRLTADHEDIIVSNDGSLKQSAELKGATLRKEVKLSERALLCGRRCRELVSRLLMPSEIYELRISGQHNCKLSRVKGRDLTEEGKVE
jgi:hypothetical protein